MVCLLQSIPLHATNSPYLLHQPLLRHLFGVLSGTHRLQYEPGDPVHPPTT
jgi:hypothetical protein